MLADEELTSADKNQKRRWHSWLMLALAGAAAVAIVMLLVRPQSTSADSAMTEHSFAGGHLVWEIQDYPAAVLAENTFLLTLKDAGGQPIQNASLAVKLEMIDMVCGDYDFVLTEVAPGVYTGEGIPLMAGLWKATLTIDGAEDPSISRTLKAVYG
ncbi:FixH family protein [Paenibacillus soyae]|uniref:FixH family protein n=1 Tax=Paenibacillus soyae TaxID=2969249 RepID=A0A9X2S9U3_9BACL|nr:FixH family protein [Paenibacillus soyae]MCR2805521.1 FixH family protein [Paenibacillus soyae]